MSSKPVTISIKIPTKNEGYLKKMKMVRVFANGPGDWGSIPGRVIPKTQKRLLDVALLSTKHYNVRIKGKVAQSKEWSSTLPNTSV